MRRLVMFLVVVSLVFVAISPTKPIDAQRPDAPQYAQRGPFTVGTREYTIEDSERPLSVTVWYPAQSDGAVEEVTYRYSLLQTQGQAILDAEPNLADGPYPLVLFSHGSGGFRYQSIFYTEHLASYGFVVMAADHPGNTLLDSMRASDEAVFFESLLQNFALRPMDELRQIAYAETLNAEDELLQGVIDMESIAVTGHSFGGYTTLALGGAQLDFATFETLCAESEALMLEEGYNSLAICALNERLDEVAAWRGLESVPEGLWPTTTDPRIRAIVPLAPWSPSLFSAAALENLTVPTMILVGTGDLSTPPETNAFPAYEALASSSKALVVFENAGHYIFVESCNDTIINLGFFGLCSDVVWDMQRAHDLITHFATAFLLATVKGDAEAAAVLDPSVVDFAGVEYQAVLE